MGSPALPLDKVNEMFLAYLEQQTAEFVKNKCGVSWNTARKYIEQGDPQRGVESFKTRLRRVSKLSQRTFEERVAFSKGVGMANLWEQLADLDDLITAAVDKLKAELEGGNGKVRLTDIVKAIQLSADLKMRLAKRVEQRRTITETVTTTTPHSQAPDPTEEELSQFTPQELHEYIQSDGQVVPAWFARATASLQQHAAAAGASTEGSRGAGAAGPGQLLAPPAPADPPGADRRPVPPATGQHTQTPSTLQITQESPAQPASHNDRPTPKHARRSTRKQTAELVPTPAGKPPRAPAPEPANTPTQTPAGTHPDRPAGPRTAALAGMHARGTVVASLEDSEPASSVIPEGAESSGGPTPLDPLAFPEWEPPPEAAD